jgi:DNA-binding PadR family transcriptional regulator
MAEKIANKLEKTMKKGFVNIFVLLVLNKEPTHGYQIKKLIEERTSGFWSPSDSTMYTILNKLRDKGLIKLSDFQDPEDTRKVYTLTKKGKDTLELMIQREREMRESLRSILLSTTEIDEDFFQESLLDIILRGPKIKNSSMHPSPINGPFLGPFRAEFLSSLKEKPKEEQLRLLKTGRNFIEDRIQNLHKILENIDKSISDLESE